MTSLLSLSSHSQKVSVTTSSYGSGNATHGKKGGGPQQTGRKATEKSTSFLVTTLEVLEALIKLASSLNNAFVTSSARQAAQLIAVNEETSKGTH